MAYNEMHEKLGNRGKCKCGGYNTKSGTQKSTFTSDWQGVEIKGKKIELTNVEVPESREQEDD